VALFEPASVRQGQKVDDLWQRISGNPLDGRQSLDNVGNHFAGYSVPI
jgi:hypothetical protein